MALIEMKDIRKDYLMGGTRVRALRGIDLSIEKGEFVAVWGPSGSGKTTLLNIMGAIDEPSEGRLFIDGCEVGLLSDDRRGELRCRTIGFIFQFFNLIPVLTALENVILPLQLRGVSFKESKRAALRRLRGVGLSEVAEHRPFNMSGGQQQRVAIARALINEPSLIIADEPTANLDSKTARMVINLMKDLNEQDMITFVFSTHDQRLLSQVKRTVHLEDGLIVEGA
ncbi:MAG: ABC transporter ATP-binding protein [Thermodesulfobacteriota bacterium]